MILQETQSVSIDSNVMLIIHHYKIVEQKLKTNIYRKNQTHL